MKLLSICIPTYNGEKSVGLLLQSILAQVDDINRHKLEICVSDNCSTDNTQTVVFDVIRQYPKVSFRYARRDQTCDPAVHFVEAVGMAGGFYCGLIGDDDLYLPDMLNVMLDRLEQAKEENIDVILTTFDMYSDWQDIDITASILRQYQQDTVFNLADPCEFAEYFGHLDNSYGNAAIFAFISNVIFHREKWLAQEVGGEAVKYSSYMQCYRNISLLKDNGRLLYLNKSYIYRGMTRNDLIAMHGMDYYKKVWKDMADLIDYFFKDELRNTLNQMLLPAGFDPGLVPADLDGRRKELK